MKIRTPVCKICRREGVKLFIKGLRCHTGKCAIDKGRPAPSGHSRYSSRDSNYRVQLREKEKVRAYYGVAEGQFRRYFRMAEKSRGATGEKLLEYLERRLDNILVVSGFIDSRRQARQLIYGGNVRVNGKRVSASSYLAKTADEVEFRPGLKIRPQIKEKVAASSGQPARVVPAWVAVDKEALKIKVLREPARSEVTLPVSEGHIVNLYSR